MNKIFVYVLIMAVLSLSLLASGCVGNDQNEIVQTVTDQEINENAQQLNLPSYAYGDPLKLKAYTYTTQYPQLIELFPCYCNCYTHSGHESLKNCYISQEGEFTDHASYCDVCIGEVLMIKNLYEEGIPLTEIRDKIDAEYGKYSEPTPTPPIPEGFVLNLKSL